MAKVSFSLIRINETPNGREVVFPYGKNWYKMSWEDVPDRYKQLYVAHLKLQGASVPDWLTPYDVGTINLMTTDIEIDLSKCIEIPENYPLEV